MASGKYPARCESCRAEFMCEVKTTKYLLRTDHTRGLKCKRCTDRENKERDWRQGEGLRTLKKEEQEQELKKIRLENQRKREEHERQQKSAEGDRQWKRDEDDRHWKREEDGRHWKRDEDERQWKRKEDEWKMEEETKQREHERKKEMMEMYLRMSPVERERALPALAGAFSFSQKQIMYK